MTDLTSWVKLTSVLTMNILIDHANVMRVEFYRLVPLFISSSGQAYLDAIEADLKKEGLWNYVERKTVALVTGNVTLSIDF